MTRINPRFVPSSQQLESPRFEKAPVTADPLTAVANAEEAHVRQRTSGKFPALAVEGSRAAFDAVPAVSLKDLQRTATKPDLSGAMVFGRPVQEDPHDLFWHYFGNRPSPQTNDEARAMMAEMADKFAPFGFKVEPIEHERMDKVKITWPNGKTEQVDFIFAMGGEKGQQRLQWLSSGTADGPKAGGKVSPQFVGWILSQFPPTNEGMREAVKALKKEKGYEDTELLEHPLRLDKLKFADGQVVDVIIGAGGPNPSWGWLPE
ncbi:MAG: hypothetical protein JNK82_23340 [Myxococcaceae bacterium]|nr:hypothetical protein [Myxococcaceae bacterium]